MRIVSTKKLAPNHKQYLLNAGLAVIEADFISIQYKPFVLGTINTNLIFTSQNAFKSFLLNSNIKDYIDKNVFCVGLKTKQLIESHGYNVVAYADYAIQLAETTTDAYAHESFTFFSGSLRRDTIPEALAKAGIQCNEIEVYETVLTPHTINSIPDGILFYSPSGVESYLQKNSINNAVCFCIGNTTADALVDITDAIVIAGKPTVENVIIQAIKYFKDNPARL